MILTFEQQWKFFQYINYNRERKGFTNSNFFYLLNIIDSLYLEYPHKIQITPLMMNSNID